MIGFFKIHIGPQLDAATLGMNGRFGSLPAAEYTLPERLLSGVKRTSTNPEATARYENYVQIEVEQFPLVA